MKRLTFLAVCALLIIIGCGKKNQTAPEEAGQDSVASAVIDSIMEETDTVMPPLFVVQKGNYYAMVYWEDIVDERSRADTDPELYQRMELQDKFRANPSQYTNLIIGDKIFKVKYVDEVLTDPDGNKLEEGVIHSRDDLPSSCARFALANPKAKVPEGTYTGIIVPDSYLETRKLLPVEYNRNLTLKLPADVVKTMEKRYGMKTQYATRYFKAGGYIYGFLRFGEEYKDYKGDAYADDVKVGLNLDVFTDGKNHLVSEQVGELFADNECDGSPITIYGAFEGPKGLEICYGRFGAGTSSAGFYYIVDNKLVNFDYACYVWNEEDPAPLWKKDIAEMRRLYVAADPTENKYTKFSKYAEVFIDGTGDWFWLRDKDNKNGAIFKRSDNKISLIAIETPRLKPAWGQKGDVYYVKVGGSAGGPSMYSEIKGFKDGKLTERFTVLEIYGEIDECTLNKRSLTPEEGRAYIENLPEFEEIHASFNDL